MRQNEIRRLALALGIPGAKDLSVGELIRSIQAEEGLMPCQSELWSAPCRIEECPFAAMCSSQPEFQAGVVASRKSR